LVGANFTAVIETLDWAVVVIRIFTATKITRFAVGSESFC